MRARTLAVIVGRWEQIKRRIEGPRHGACQSDPGVRTTCTEVSKENNKSINKPYSHRVLPPFIFQLQTTSS